jgi:hypothetical protein
MNNLVNNHQKHGQRSWPNIHNQNRKKHDVQIVTTNVHTWSKTWSTIVKTHVQKSSNEASHVAQHPVLYGGWRRGRKKEEGGRGREQGRKTTALTHRGLIPNLDLCALTCLPEFLVDVLSDFLSTPTILTKAVVVGSQSSLVVGSRC